MIKRSIWAVLILLTAPGSAHSNDASDQFTFKVGDKGPKQTFEMSCNVDGGKSRKHEDYHYSECAQIETARGQNPATHSTAQRAPDLAKHAGPILTDVATWLYSMGFRRTDSWSGSVKVMLHPKGIQSKKTLYAEYVARTGSAAKQMWLYLDSALKHGEFSENDHLTDSIAHELFHGAQFAYERMAKKYIKPGQPPKPNDWFVEATAVYVGGYYLQTKVSEQPLNLLKERDYEQPLMDITESSDEGYATHAFYAALARRMSGDLKSKGLRSLTLKSMSPAYLGRVMESINGSSEEKFLDAFDKALAATGPFGVGLYRMYPEVMRDLAYGPDHDHKKPFPFNGGSKAFMIKFSTAKDPETIAEEEVNGVSTDFYFINSDKLSEEQRLLIELEPAKGAEAHDQDLHLIVDGQLVSFKSPRQRNRAILRKTDKPAMIGIANVAKTASDSKTVKYRLKITRLEGGNCDYESIYDSTDFGEHRKAMLENNVPPVDVSEFYASMYPTPDKYLNEYGKRTSKGLQQPDIHPDIAYLSISSQGMTAGGDGCAHHLASSTLLETELMGNPAGLPGARTQGKEIARDLTRIFGALNKARNGRDPSFKSPSRSGINRLYRRMKGAFGWDARDGSVMVTVFSPNLYGFWQGHAAYAGEGPMIGSSGGWGAKESAAVTIMLPGTQVKDLEEGRVYPAISVGAAMGGPLPILSRWTGVWTTKLGPEGTFDMLMPQQLSGYVQIEKIEGGRIFASFNLNGHGTHTRTIRYKEDNGEQEIMVEKDESPGATSIFVSGEFTAPIVTTGTQIYRNMYMQRSVSRTREGR